MRFESALVPVQFGLVTLKARLLQMVSSRPASLCVLQKENLTHMYRENSPCQPAGEAHDCCLLHDIIRDT